ncbi:MAG TPA: peptide deformylase [Faecalibacter sp.]
MRKIVTLFLFFSSVALIAQPMTQDYEKLTKDEMALIKAKSSKTPMRVLLTTSASDTKILRDVSKDLDPKDPLTLLLSERMYATVQDELSKGVGIAAPQVGINRNAIWVQRFDKEGQPFEFYINPKITWLSSIMRHGREGCLSIPDQFGKVYRSLALQLNYFDLEGNQYEEIIEGFTAVIFQHEYDHLIGKLFLDRIEEQSKSEFIKASDVNEVYYQKK